jgi:hypothetical protein
MSTTTSELPLTRGANLKDLHEVEPINEGDHDCLDEVCAVLKKHGKLERFAISLLHKHFDLAADEVLVEYNDPHTRVLTVQPVKQEGSGHTMETMWMFVDGELVPTLYCESKHCRPGG